MCRLVSGFVCGEDNRSTNGSQLYRNKIRWGDMQCDWTHEGTVSVDSIILVASLLTFFGSSFTLFNTLLVGRGRGMSELVGLMASSHMAWSFTQIIIYFRRLFARDSISGSDCHFQQPPIYFFYMSAAACICCISYMFLRILHQSFQQAKSTKDSSFDDLLRLTKHGRNFIDGMTWLKFCVVIYLIPFILVSIMLIGGGISWNERTTLCRLEPSYALPYLIAPLTLVTITTGIMLLISFYLTWSLRGILSKVHPSFRIARLWYPELRIMFYLSTFFICEGPGLFLYIYGQATGSCFSPWMSALDNAARYSMGFLDAIIYNSFNPEITAHYRQSRFVLPFTLFFSPLLIPFLLYRNVRDVLSSDEGEGKNGIQSPLLKSNKVSQVFIDVYSGM
ncbi:hypothetical protein PROFUN_08832 [Planoprotostelium fungivorum]|uniref:Transmembrane protein n=1 Tax=Planoprotostelium fungivorum TaxID=1890364 RepID=A0A2P6NIW3_9EUKA|nr:hypothetical protein PROFUN_08832 [Planoprotostelium fungivorum]